jgi:hypothetical protein
MTTRTDDLIADLIRDLRPVKLLSSLYRVSARVLTLTAATVALAAALGVAGGLLLPKPPTISVAAGIGGHLLLALGALAVALGSCVPGRDALERTGYVAAAVGAGTTIAVAIFVLRSGPPSGLGLAWAADTLVCTMVATLPALVPAVLLVEFARAGAPHRPARPLAFGALATVGFATLPGQLGCPVPGALHGAVAHLLAPATGGAVIFLCSVLLFGRDRAAR